MARLILASLFILLLAFPINIAAQDELCPEDSPEEDIDSGEEYEGELEAGEGINFIHDSDVNVVWRIDMESSDTLLLNFFLPDVNGDYYFDVSIEADALATAMRTVIEGDHCIEVRNESDESIDYSITFTELESRNGELQNVEGLDSEGNNVVGVYYHTLGDLETALEFYALALEQNPNDAQVLDNSCIALRDLGEYEDALDFCLEAVELESDNAFYAQDTAIIFQALGDFESAQGYLETAIELDPSYPDFLHSLGTNHVLLGNADEAVEIFDEYVDVADVWFETYWRGLAYLNAGDYENAIEDIEEAIEADEAEPALYHLWLGIALLANGSEDDAEEAFELAEEILEETVGESTLFRSRAFYAVFLGDNEDAEEYYQDAIDIGTVFTNRGDLFYVTILSNVFPDEEGYAEARQWLLEELNMD